MNREILFRGKAINRDERYETRTRYKNGDWVYGLVSSLGSEKYDIPMEMTNTDGISGIEVDRKTIGQYTGVKDKNGVRIFEGDILKTSFIKDVLKAVVKFGYYSQPDKLLRTHLGFYFDFIDPIDSELFKKDVGYWIGRTQSEIEVIGNIYDNPELMEDKENEQQKSRKNSAS